jgi:hypothetical protein
MDVYLFVSSAFSLSAFTSEQSGANLPTEYGPWTPGNGGRVIVVKPSDPVGRAVPKNGFSF